LPPKSSSFTGVFCMRSLKFTPKNIPQIKNRQETSLINLRRDKIKNSQFEHSKYKEPLQYERQRSVTVMSEKLALVTCTSCGKPIPPGSESTKFLCPQCGEIQIKRDGKCRKFGRLYKCPKCGFSGP
jgi:predicted RNA-binding Zn-ribbon protein involved in translation (DUF1610 family)